ncbi:arsenite efflux transporter metallochaperone ArsD [Eubacteriales bacterium OttesenSCG-928-A19]|nr:arsenite efflux transporter metallochaperone ArsD [Eubacteriales bacterium OttesenSCG-928-A19]
MKTMSIYEPAMCCETGLCGVGVDPELLRISTALSNLKKNGVEVKRYNLSNYPQEFIKNAEVNKLIMGDGVDSLPATVVDGKIVMTKKYPTNAEIAELLGVPKEYLGEEKKQENGGGCCCDDGGCC